MSRKDLFSKYTQIYQKARAKEIVPEGAFVRQFTDLVTEGFDVSVFFKSRREKDVKQVYLNNPLPAEVSEETGLLEALGRTFLSRTIIENMKGIQYIRVVIDAGKLLDSRDERIAFVKKCQRIIDVLIRKARNVVHFGDFSAFRVDKKIKTLTTFLEKELKMDEVSIEAASIPFLMASPEYVLLTGSEILVVGDEPRVPHGVFHLVGGVGYAFDKKEGAVHEERMFDTAPDLKGLGITEAYIDEQISKMTEDFQNKVHSIIYSDIWRKSVAKPLGVNIDSDLLIKTGPSSEMMSGVFEVYVRVPKT